jgi:UDP-hydrolysing UDP-N-acetyl-D-glucosamine 2-epimerase
VTGSRADYGHLRPVLRALAGDPDCETAVIACGTHLVPQFGSTVSEIEADGFVIAARIETLVAGGTPVGIAKSMALGLIGIAEALDRLRPDLVVLLGDRFEILAAAQAASVCRIPIAHLHGGELSEGALDDAFRHAVTKLSSLHFVANTVYADRVMQLGEAPERVFVTGAPGLDAIAETRWRPRPEILAELGFGAAIGGTAGPDARVPLLVVTQHPATLDPVAGLRQGEALIAALAHLPQALIVVTGVNADPDHAPLAAALAAFVTKDPARRRAVVSLGQRRYLELVAAADLVVGNSSSGLIEAPALGIPSIDIGDRQRGRLRAGSVIHCDGTEAAIRAALDTGLSEAFRTTARAVRSPYGDGQAAPRIRDVLKSVPLSGLIDKVFRDLPAQPSMRGGAGK